MLALVEEYPPVAAFLATDKENDVVARGELADVRHAVGHLPADGVVVFESSVGADVLFDVFHNPTEVIQRFCGLTVKADIPVEVQFPDVLGMLYDNGRAVGLPHQSQYLGMTVLSENNNLLAVERVGIVLAFDALLQMEHNGAGGIYDFDVVGDGLPVGAWRFAVSTQQDGGVVETVVFLVSDGDESHALQTVAFHGVVNDIA